MGIRVAIREPGFTVPGTVEQAPLKGANFSRDVSSGFVEIAQGRAQPDDPHRCRSGLQRAKTAATSVSVAKSPASASRKAASISAMCWASRAT